MSNLEMLLVLVDSFPLRRAAYASLFESWAVSNGFTIAELADTKTTRAASVLTLVVLGGKRIGSPEGRARLEAVTLDAEGPVAAIVESQTPKCVTVAHELRLKGVLCVSEASTVIFAALGFIVAGGCYIPHVRPPHVGPSERSYLPKRMDSVPAPSHSVGRGEAEDVDDPDLTPRQYDVLRGLEYGASNKEIARTLNLSEATVKSHIRHVMRKLNVDNRTQAALRARDFRHDAFLLPVAVTGK